jgi:hypothetical protein
MAELCAKHTWRLVEMDISEHGEIGRYVCTTCGAERLSEGAPEDEEA